MMFEETITIAPRFNGPPDSGNGGYVCGLVGQQVSLAGPLPHAAEVTLRMPPPLGKPLRLEVRREGVRLLSGEHLIADGKPALLEMEVPESPDFFEATEAAKRYRGFAEHFFPDCFVCGPNRDTGDGLRIFAGPVGEGLVAAPWVPDDSLTSFGATVAEEFCWAAIDCPGHFAATEEHLPVVLGRMTCAVTGTVRSGERCVVIGWPLGRDGRKFFAGTALFNEDGRCIARSRQVWVQLRS
ncbi:MAG: hypothetical protein IT368_16470 [Candidatus Hydrogenedentes bacterium]|nr:hypothetical protein [Candidatus Hydrogenedentota bacterium]